MNEVIENHATSKLPRGLCERLFMSGPIENNVTAKLPNVLLNNHQCKHRQAKQD